MDGEVVLEDETPTVFDLIDRVVTTQPLVIFSCVALDYAGLAKVMRRRQFLMRTELPNKWRSGACARGLAA